MSRWDFSDPERVIRENTRASSDPRHSGEASDGPDDLERFQSDSTRIRVEFIYLAPTERLFRAAEMQFKPLVFGRSLQSETISLREYFRIRKAGMRRNESPVQKSFCSRTRKKNMPERSSKLCMSGGVRARQIMPNSNAFR